LGRLGEDLPGRQEFCEQGTAMGIRMWASSTLVLYFYMLMQRDDMGVVFVELEKIRGDIDRSMFVIEGKIRFIFNVWSTGCPLSFLHCRIKRQTHRLASLQR
jgi:hypothetical protein